MTEDDCGTREGILMTPVDYRGAMLRTRCVTALGRVTAEDALKPGTADILVPQHAAAARTVV